MARAGRGGVQVYAGRERFVREQGAVPLPSQLPVQPRGGVSAPSVVPRTFLGGRGGPGCRGVVDGDGRVGGSHPGAAGCGVFVGAARSRGGRGHFAGDPGLVVLVMVLVLGTAYLLTRFSSKTTAK